MEQFVKKLKRIWPKKPHFLSKYRSKIEERPIWHAYLYARYIDSLPSDLYNYIILSSFESSQYKDDVQTYLAWEEKCKLQKVV